MKRRILCVVLWSCALSLAAASAGGEGMDLIRTTAKVSLSPCPTCPPFKTTLDVGQELQVIDGTEDRSWLLVQVVPGDERGWLSAQYVTAPPGIVDALREKQVIHRYSIQGFFWLAIAGVVLSFAALFASRRRVPGPFFSTLLFDPKIVISWFVMLESGILGVMLFTSSLFDVNGVVLAEHYFKIAAVFGYSGWALYWGAPPFRHMLGKWAPWLLAWFSCGIVAILLIPLLALAFTYSFFGGGLFHFLLHCWAIGKAAPTAAPAQSTGQEPKPEPKLEEAKPLGDRWQLEHPEW